MAPAFLSASVSSLHLPLTTTKLGPPPQTSLNSPLTPYGNELALLESTVTIGMLAVSSTPSVAPSLLTTNGRLPLQRKPVHAGASTISASEKNMDAMASEFPSTAPSYKAPVMPAVPEESPSMSMYSRPRPNSVASFISSGTIEVEGFGFDNDSDEDDTYSVFGNSVYEESVYGDDGRRSERPVSPTTLMRRADRILEGAKKRLDLCGENLTKARESMVVSPGPAPSHAAVEARWQSFGGSMNPSALNALRERRDSAHFRTSSESAVGGTSNGQEVERAQSALGPRHGTQNGEMQRQELSRSKSTQQMRTLRDQMKDLRGKITNLQHQTRTDSLRRRSMNSLRSNSRQDAMQEDDYSMDSAVWVEGRDTLEEVEEVDEQEYETVPEEMDEEDGRGTPKPYNPMRESRHEDREDAFSYDSLFLGNGLYATHRDLMARRPVSMESNSSAGTITGIAPSKKDPAPISRPTHSRNNSQSTVGRRSVSPRKRGERRDSINSMQSFRTANSYRTANEISAVSSNASSPTDELMEAHHPLRPTPRAWMSPPEFSPRDDGYHSAPTTPKVSDPLSALDHNSRPLPPTSHPITIGRHTDPPRNPRLLGLANGIQSKGSGLTHNLVVTTSHQPQHGSAISREVGLRLGDNDAEMVDRLVEVLGKVCVRLEVSAEDQKMEYRLRMEKALAILEGRTLEEEEDETF